MKKAFTMVELIFVIVVLGILATIALPKLFASKKEAEVLVLKNELATIRSNIESAYQDSLLSGKAQYPKPEDIKKVLSKNKKWTVHDSSTYIFKITNAKTIEFKYIDGKFECVENVAKDCEKLGLNL